MLRSVGDGVLAADISAYRGEYAALTFSLRGDEYSVIDDIRFVPEPRMAVWVPLLLLVSRLIGRVNVKAAGPTKRG